MAKISVIIPVYNTEEYLHECLDNVLNQTFDDFEVICVDDGSTDRSNDILNDYKSRDGRIIVVTQENEGLSSARNAGLKHAGGDYVLFLDSDDYLEDNALEDLYNLSQAHDLDMVIFKIINFDDATRELSHYSYFELEVLKKLVGDRVFNYEDIKEKFFRIPVTAPGKLYRRDLLDDMEFRQGLIFEDNPFFAEVMLKVKRAMVIDEYLYFRRLRDESITNSNYEKFSDCVEVYNIISDIIKDYGKYEDLKGQLFHRRCRDIFLRFSQVPTEFKKDFFDIIKDDFLLKKMELENDGTLEIASKRSKEIYTRAIESDSFRQFELSVEVFDLKREISKLKKQNRKYKSQIEDINNSKSKKSLKKLFKL